jgi:hypothetical protein
MLRRMSFPLDMCLRMIRPLFCAAYRQPKEECRTGQPAYLEINQAEQDQHMQRTSVALLPPINIKQSPLFASHQDH